MSDMVDTAHLFTVIATNATETSATSPMNSERAHQMTDRMASIINATSAMTEMAHMASGDLTANLLNATTDFLQRQAGSIDIGEVNALMHTLSDNETIARAFGAVNDVQGQIDNITETGVSMLRHIAAGVLQSFESGEPNQNADPSGLLAAAVPRRVMKKP
ncbi:hypothetical protein CYMTET_37402 [Cymbomonas tetramitiformis]|uniref:Uncharacterized protein n=1 Tax=Cymbomonas tetramitiformis TaxID=36881 RepID=A0AAE0F6B7_9CHLO|nr:hypothetical protein CYMTET_37402 [Cymbomonas tetramitiformis]